MANTFVFDDEEEPQPTMESPQEYPSDEIDEEDGDEEEGEGATAISSLRPLYWVLSSC